MQPDIKAADRSELPPSMEPLLLADRHRGPLTDLTLDLTQKTAAFRASVSRRAGRTLDAGLVSGPSA